MPNINTYSYYRKEASDEKTPLKPFNFTSNGSDGAGYCVKDTGNSYSVIWDTYDEDGSTYTLQGMAASGDYVVFGNDYGYVYSIY